MNLDLDEGDFQAGAVAGHQDGNVSTEPVPSSAAKKRGCGQAWMCIRTCKTQDDFLKWVHGPYALSLGAKWVKKRSTSTLEGSKDYFKCAASQHCQAQLVALYGANSDDVKVSRNQKEHLHAEDHNSKLHHGLVHSTKLEVEKVFSAGVTKPLQISCNCCP